MTKRDFENIATAIRKVTNDPDCTCDCFLSGQDSVADVIADALQENYPRFNRAKFMKACYGDKN